MRASGVRQRREAPARSDRRWPAALGPPSSLMDGGTAGASGKNWDAVPRNREKKWNQVSPGPLFRNVPSAGSVGSFRGNGGGREEGAPHTFSFLCSEAFQIGDSHLGLGHTHLRLVCGSSVDDRALSSKTFVSWAACWGLWAPISFSPHSFWGVPSAPPP